MTDINKLLTIALDKAKDMTEDIEEWVYTTTLNRTCCAIDNKQIQLPNHDNYFDNNGNVINYDEYRIAKENYAMDRGHEAMTEVIIESLADADKFMLNSHAYDILMQVMEELRLSYTPPITTCKSAIIIQFGKLDDYDNYIWSATITLHSDKSAKDNPTTNINWYEKYGCIEQVIKQIVIVMEANK